jgi:predicted nucleic acid-binding protein
MEGHELDRQIAAIARSSGASVATRNLRDFTGCGVEIINPWEAAATQ